MSKRNNLLPNCTQLLFRCGAYIGGRRLTLISAKVLALGPEWLLSPCGGEVLPCGAALARLWRASASKTAARQRRCSAKLSMRRRPATAAGFARAAGPGLSKSVAFVDGAASGLREARFCSGYVPATAQRS